MSGLIDAVKAGVARTGGDFTSDARAAVLAHADWLDAQPEGPAYRAVARLLRAEVAPPPPPTAEDVIREWLVAHGQNFSGSAAYLLAKSLADAGLLREDAS